jgi:hypothetical protein
VIGGGGGGGEKLQMRDSQIFKVIPIFLKKKKKGDGWVTM